MHKDCFGQGIFLRRILFTVIMLGTLASCKKESGNGQTTTDTTGTSTAFDINSIKDTYAEVAAYDKRTLWGPYNTHDPSLTKAGDWYYCYSTDAAYGLSLPPGIMMRKSKDLVEWSYLGSVFNGLPAMASQYITSKGFIPNNGLWAPYIMQADNEYRLYYSLASNGFRVSCIGLATASSPEGPWVERGVVVTSETSGPGTNAIDPTVTVTPSGEHWMVYGSAWDGLFELKLNPATGLAFSSGDRGTRVVRRGMTNGIYNGNLEGPEIIYNPDTRMYYLFVAYDWLSTKYNVRVFRSANPNGPFLDWKGDNADNQKDHGPMILAPYQFQNHSGWAGVSHCSVFQDNGQYYIAHQGRPGIDRAFMVLHVRKIFWTEDKWPVVSPERYAWEDNATVPLSDLAGDYEQIILGYRVVPGYEYEQITPDYQTSISLTLSANGTMNGDAGNKWTYTAPWLELKWANGYTDKVFVQKGRDWENKKNTIIFSGLNNDGTAIWGKKK
jgi:arabinan endo-1,5-alpha-L-arabinosidase